MNERQHSETDRLAKHLMQPIAESVRRRARLHLLDWLGCVAGARTSTIARIQISIAGLSAVDKAVWLGNVLEMDDVHRTAILHPGPVIWPTVLGVGNDVLDDALDAAVRGYEATIAIGSMLDARHYAFWHKTATAGTFGAVVAAAARLGATQSQLVSALGLAGSVTGGLWQMRHEPVMAKQWHLAHAMATGIQAARHACHGVTGPRFILEGPQGLFAATCSAPRPLELSDNWRIAEVSFKPWGACRHAHPAIDAALELKSKGELQGAVTVSTYRDALVFCDRPDPGSALEAKFSLQHAVAIVVERGVPQLADFELEAIAALSPARRRISVQEDAGFTYAYPAHFGARVSCASGEVTLADALGDPERPLAEAGIVAKAQTLMEWGRISSTAIDAAVQTVFETDRVGDIKELLGDWL
ncbi:MAG: MmgE/PrpD family protein [Steroidobacteraceae bacterium]